MKLRIRIYQLLVNRVPMIQKKYHEIRQQKKGLGGRLYAWFVLLGMNLMIPFCAGKWERNFVNPDENKKIPEGGSESALSLRESPELFAMRLAKYDVISFDVFDTLIFRPFSSPTDLFFVIGEKLSYPDFERIRCLSEAKVRQRAFRRSGSYEVTLDEIYEEMSCSTGIDKKNAMWCEIETETALCFANPYMLEVVRNLQLMGKKIICTSDMYLPEHVIRMIVEKNGYKGISNYFISCEHHANKGSGSLYKIVRQQIGGGKTYIHVGDHPDSDVKQALKQGFGAEFYQNVNVAGMLFRAEDLSTITGSVYRGVVNAHIRNGWHRYSCEYELGFIYGGLFVLGYCRFIHEYVKKNRIDKVLFLARDGEILSKVYNRLYGEEDKTQYVYWSRLVATKMTASYYKYDYFRRFIDHKINQNFTFKQILQSMELEDMLERLCNVFRESGWSEDTRLTSQNADKVKEFLLENWDEVLEHYVEQIDAGKSYYTEVLAGCKRVVAVDIGWAGSGALTLDHMVNRVWRLNCEVIGILAGTNTVHNAEPNMSEAQLNNGKLVSYLYSQSHNRDIWKWHDAAQNHNLGLELLLTSEKGSLKRFVKSGEDGYCFCLKEPDTDKAVVREIQKGIMDFVECMVPVLDRYDINISGRDAYGVLKMFLERYEYYIKNLDSVNKNVMTEVGI